MRGGGVRADRSAVIGWFALISMPNDEFASPPTSPE
jgi:hypothetical protein